MSKTNSGTNCFLKHPVNGSKRRNCQAAKKCVGGCGSLRGININLYDGCTEACQNSPRPRNAEDYQNRYVGAQVMYEYYGVSINGYGIETTDQYKIYQLENQNDLRNRAAVNNNNRMLLIGAAVLAFLLFISNR